MVAFFDRSWQTYLMCLICIDPHLCKFLPMTGFVVLRGMFDPSTLDAARPHVQPSDIEAIHADPQCRDRVVFGNASTGEDPTKVSGSNAGVNRHTTCVNQPHMDIIMYLSSHAHLSDTCDLSLYIAKFLHTKRQISDSMMSVWMYSSGGNIRIQLSFI